MNAVIVRIRALVLILVSGTCLFLAGQIIGFHMGLHSTFSVTYLGTASNFSSQGENVFWTFSRTYLLIAIAVLLYLAGQSFRSKEASFVGIFAALSALVYFWFDLLNYKFLGIEIGQTDGRRPYQDWIDLTLWIDYVMIGVLLLVVASDGVLFLFNNYRKKEMDYPPNA